MEIEHKRSVINVTTDNAVLGAVIVQLREARNPPMLQADLAKLMDLTASAWSRVEKGETQLTAFQIHRLASLLDTSIDQVFVLVERLESELKSKGIETKTLDFIKSKAKSSTTNAMSGKALGALAACGIIPVFGPALAGIAAGALAMHLVTKEKNNEK